MNDTSTSGDNIDAYVFRFDDPIEPRIFGDRYDLSGWLLHSGGKPIHGIRAVRKRLFARREIFPARRKRTRLDIAAAFPHLPEAKTSGFLLELRLGLGCNHLALQVRDQDRVWHTFRTIVISAYPLLFLKKLGFRHLREFLIAYLQQRHGAERSLPQLPLPENPTTSHSQSIATKRVDLFATTKSNLFILEIGQLIAAGFRELGCDTHFLLDKLPAKVPAPDTLQIVVTPHEYYNLFLTEKVSLEQADELTKNVVLLCTEQPETGWFYNNLPWATKARAVADINLLGVTAYRARGVESYHFRLGYHDMLSASGLTPHGERRYDVTFLGSMTPRRDEFFAEHAPFFASHQCHIRFVPIGFAKTEITRSYLSSGHRNELLSQTRVLLNVHYSERKYFEWHRGMVALANGCCLISETSEGHGDLVPGKHFIMADREDLIACCDYYLAHPREAEAIAQQGLDFVRTHLRQAQTCQTFLQDLHSRNQSTEIVIADARPLALSRTLNHALNTRKFRQLKRAIAQDWQSLTTRTSLSSDINASPSPSLPNQSLIIERREAYKSRLSEQEAARARGEQIWEYYDNEAYRLLTEPKLAIVITLFNYAHYIHECIASIEKAAENLSWPIELVIVNDASSDDSLARALSCQKESELAIRIVDKRFNTGLADARNAGVHIARAPYIFMMDADNLIFPRGLQQLLDAISMGSYAAAYSLLCRFRGTPSNRIGLLSYYDWDPQILVQQPYIDAMAMFRRDALLQTGGYDNELSQIGWFGWEDYDMWLRFAQNNYNVTFVPNIFCLYRHHETSMINLTNLFETELVEHFMNRYGKLVSQFEPREMLFGVAREKISSFPEISSRVSEAVIAEP